MVILTEVAWGTTSSLGNQTDFTQLLAFSGPNPSLEILRHPGQASCSMEDRCQGQKSGPVDIYKIVLKSSFITCSSPSSQGLFPCLFSLSFYFFTFGCWYLLSSNSYTSFLSWFTNPKALPDITSFRHLLWGICGYC